MKDPCVDCNKLRKRDLFLEQNGSLFPNPGVPGDSFLLHQNPDQFQQDHKEYINLFENAPDAIIVADTETGTILEANHKAADLFGRPIDEIVGMHQSHLHAPEDRDKYSAMFHEHCQIDMVHVLENIEAYNKKDSQKIPVEISISTMQLGSQKVICGFFRDTTEQKRQRQQLEESQGRFKRLAEASFEGVIVHDLQTNIDTVNQHFLDMYGYTSDELKQTPLINLVAPQCRNEVADKFASGFQGIYETSGLKKDGTVFPVLVNVKEAVLDSRPIRIVSVFDRTEYTQQQQIILDTLKESEERYRNIFNAMSEGVIVGDLETSEIQYANPALCKMLRGTEQEIVGLGAKDFHSESEAPKVFQFLSNLREGEDATTQLQYICRDGSLRNAIVTGTLIRIDGKRFALAFVNDVTELMASQERYKRLSEAAFEGICIHDKGCIVDANPQFAKIFGFRSDEVKGADCYDLMAPQSIDMVRGYIETGYEGPYQCFAVKKDGSEFPVEVRARQIELDEKHFRMAVFRDLTEQKKLQQELADSEDKYRQLYKMAHAALFRTRISDGMLMDCSHATATLFGYDNEAEYKNSFSVTDTYADPQQRQVFIETLKKDKRVHGFQVQLKRKDGTPIWVAISAKIFPEQDCIEGAMKDITLTKILTKTERTVLNHLMQGMSNKNIAYKTKRSVRTIEDHRANIMRKLNVDNIVDLTRKALEGGITPDGK